LSSTSADTETITRISVHGLHGSSDLDVELKPRLNILYGHNGTGKTTLLHVLANLLEGDIERFTHLRFEKIEIATLSGGTATLLRRRIEGQIAIELQIDHATVCEIKRGASALAKIDPGLLARSGPL
jgi:predicted ATP-binding protein involved in virulence